MSGKNKTNSSCGNPEYAQLSARYKLLESLMDSVPDVIYFKDINGRLIMVNQAHARGLGLAPKEVIGKTDFDIFPRARAERMRKDDLQVIKTGKPIIDKIERATRPDGVDNYVSTTKIPRFDKNGKIIGIIGITRDITRRIHLDQVVQQKEVTEKKIRDLEELNKMKSELISVVSHELRTPLAIVNEAVNLVYEGIPGVINQRQKEILDKAQANLQRLKRMTDELLDLSRIEGRDFKLRYSLVNFNDLLGASLDFFKRAAAEKKIELSCDLPKKQVNIFLDFERINQVIYNLLNNAIKYTEEGGRISVEVKILENKLRVGVIDSGIGIAKDDLNKIFNKFVQVSRIPQFRQKGVGLGLSIVKELIEKHEGEIWVESKPGVGSKFYFTLPFFYTLRELNKNSQDKVNRLLEKNIPLYLINILVVNYRIFRKMTRISPQEFFSGLREIISRSANRTGEKLKSEIIFMDDKFGECSIIFPRAHAGQVSEFCDRFKKGVTDFIKQKDLREVFINIGVVAYSPEGKLKQAQGLPVNLHISKIYIGSEVRRFRRMEYKANIDILLPGKIKDPSEVIDISEGGICLASSRQLKTDSRIRLDLKLPSGRQLSAVPARVAWIKVVDTLRYGEGQSYKIGLEFIRLDGAQKKVISGFIKSRTA
ncbi:MAG: ATP-binding protein [Candidatus Omnitrophica bacterium]|nr:ATP-binding protein [Candidatus Omnitrophota bacterium]